MLPSKKLKPLSKKNLKSPGQTLLKRVQHFSHKNSLWSFSERFVIGVSGGPDSTCLTHILYILREKYNFSLHIVHINYRLRGKESDQDEKFVQDLGKRLNIPVSVYQPRTVKNPSENILRKMRYTQFESTRKRLGFTAIAVGHNKNDQAETLLLHLLRGGGLNGLSGMLPKNNRVVRPLLHVPRAAILSYLKIHTLLYREDATNDQPTYVRNAIRLKLIPYIAKNFQPKIVDILARDAENIAKDYAYIKNHSPHIQDSFSVSVLLSQHEAVQNIMLRDVIQRKIGLDSTISTANIQEILKMCRSKKNKSQKVTFHGLKFTRRGDKVYTTNYKSSTNIQI